MIMSKLIKQLSLILLLIMCGFQSFANDKVEMVIDKNGVRIERDGVVYRENMMIESNPNDYNQSDVPATINSYNPGESNKAIKYDIFDIQKDEFVSDVERNCVFKEIEGNSKSYACSDNQSVVITENALFSKKETTVNNDLFGISKTQYSYVIYGLLLLLLLVFI